MFLLLVRIFLWLLVSLLLYFFLLKFIPKSWLTILGGLIIFALIVVSFYDPSKSISAPAWRVFAFPFRPVGMSVLLLLLGWVRLLGKTANVKAAKPLITSGLAILLIFSIPIIGDKLVQAYEKDTIVADRERQENVKTNEPAAAIVLLGQDTTKNNLPYRQHIQLTDRGDRLLYASQIYQDQKINKGRAPLIIISAGPREYLSGKEKDRLEAPDISRVLQGLNVPQSDILLETESNSIHQSATKVKKKLAEQKLLDQPVMLVTSGLQMRRAQLTFVHEGINVIAMPTEFYSFQPKAKPPRKITTVDFLPSVEGLGLSTKVVDEFFGSIYYFLRGWLSPAWR
jgi:uncharacterized SAM-binding protein YcdF (DUF218 family)